MTKSSRGSMQDAEGSPTADRAATRKPYTLSRGQAVRAQVVLTTLCVIVSASVCELATLL